MQSLLIFIIPRIIEKFIYIVAIMITVIHISTLIDGKKVYVQAPAKLLIYHIANTEHQI